MTYLSHSSKIRLLRFYLFHSAFALAFMDFYMHVPLTDIMSPSLLKQKPLLINVGSRAGAGWPILPVGNGLVGHGHFASDGNPGQFLEWQASVKVLHFIFQYNYTRRKEELHYLGTDLLYPWKQDEGVQTRLRASRERWRVMCSHPKSHWNNSEGILTERYTHNRMKRIGRGMWPHDFGSRKAYERVQNWLNRPK